VQYQKHPVHSCWFPVVRQYSKHPGRLIDTWRSHLGHTQQLQGYRSVKLRLYIEWSKESAPSSRPWSRPLSTAWNTYHWKISRDLEKMAPQQFCKQVSNGFIMSCKSCTMHILPIYVIQDGTCTMLPMLDHKILTYPCYKVILKCSLDKLVQQIWWDYLIDVATWEVRSKQLRMQYQRWITDRNNNEMAYNDVVVDLKFDPQCPRIQVVYQTICVGWYVWVCADIKIVQVGCTPDGSISSSVQQQDCLRVLT